MVFIFLSWLDLLGVALVFRTSTLKSKLLTQGYRYHKLRKTFGKFFRAYSDLLSKFGKISFQEYVSEGISHPVFYGDLVYKLRRVKCEANFVSPGSKIVKHLRRRKYDPVIIERTIGLVLGPYTALCRSFRGDKAPLLVPLTEHTFSLLWGMSLYICGILFLSHYMFVW